MRRVPRLSLPRSMSAALPILAALAASAPASAAEPLAPAGQTLPTFARSPAPPSAESSAVWSGFSYGVEAFGVSGKGARGGVGGAANVAWRKAIDESLSVQLKTSAGYMPGVWKGAALARAPWGRNAITGANFVVSEASVAYEIGRLRPWASVGAGYAKATRFGGFSGGLNALNDMASERGKGTGFVTVGAGVDYAVTNNLTLGVAVHGVQAR